MSIRVLDVVVIAMALAVPSIAVAQSNYQRFMALDTNQDGAISRQEMENGRTALFNRADSNHDNSISQAEREAMGGQLQHARGRVDADGNGVITRDEFMSRPYPIFDRFDADHNDVLDAKEIATVRAHAAELMDYQ